MKEVNAFNLNLELEYWADNLHRENDLSTAEIGSLQIRLLDEMDVFLNQGFSEEKAFQLALRNVSLIPNLNTEPEENSLFLNKFKIREYRDLQKYHSYMFLGLVGYLFMGGFLNFISKVFLLFGIIGPIQTQSAAAFDFSVKTIILLGILFFSGPIVRMGNKAILLLHNTISSTPFLAMFVICCLLFGTSWASSLMNLSLAYSLPFDQLSAIFNNASFFNIFFLFIIISTYSVLLLRSKSGSYSS